MLDSFSMYEQAKKITKNCETRDPDSIAHQLGIRVYEETNFTDLLGMYTFRWNHRLMFLNANMDESMRRIVIAHELGHDQLHRECAKQDGMKEFVLFNMKDTTEYEANAFASHILLENDEVYRLARQGNDIITMAGILGSHVNLLLIKMQEMNKLGYDFRLPCAANSRFLRNPEKGI